MSAKIINILALLICLSLCLVSAEPEPISDGKYRRDPSDEGKYRPKSKDDGKYRPSKFADGKYRSRYNNNGKYIPVNEGRYIPMFWPYMHVHDNRELGRYVHIHIPYNGGYGPYDGDPSLYQYLNDGKGDYSLYTTTTTTTARPRTTYNDEGKWRIIRQEEEKLPKKYDYLYLTENGIYAEEKATLDGKTSGTSGDGFYYYTGDDGKMYTISYNAGEQGFLPMAEHLPLQLQKALQYIAEKDKRKLEEKSKKH